MDSEGLIVKALSGFYEVQTAQKVERCRARGLFRKEGITPLVGDRVRIAQGLVTEILPRKNSFLRPPVSNLDLLVVVAADAIPVTEPFLIDRVIAIAANQGVPTLLVVNKTDLTEGDRLASMRRRKFL